MALLLVLLSIFIQTARNILLSQFFTSIPFLDVLLSFYLPLALACTASTLFLFKRNKNVSISEIFVSFIFAGFYLADIEYSIALSNHISLLFLILADFLSSIPFLFFSAIVLKRSLKRERNHIFASVFLVALCGLSMYIDKSNSSFIILTFRFMVALIFYFFYNLVAYISYNAFDPLNIISMSYTIITIISFIKYLQPLYFNRISRETFLKKPLMAFPLFAVLYLHAFIVPFGFRELNDDLLYLSKLPVFIATLLYSTAREVWM